MIDQGGYQMIDIHRQSEVPVAVGELEGKAHFYKSTLAGIFITS